MVRIGNDEGRLRYFGAAGKLASWAGPAWPRQLRRTALRSAALPGAPCVDFIARFPLIAAADAARRLPGASQSSGSTFTMLAPWFDPAQNTGFAPVSSTTTRRTLVGFGS